MVMYGAVSGEATRYVGRGPAAATSLGPVHSSANSMPHHDEETSCCE